MNNDKTPPHIKLDEHNHVEKPISVGLEGVKKETEQYLRQQYTNGDGQMICQVCKTLLPFKLDDGNDYFEMVEFLPELNMRYS